MTTLSIKTFTAVATKLPIETSILLRGPHGIGKSQVVRQLAAQFGLEVIDRRLSQMSEGDMIGLPSTDGEVTRFNPPEWYKAACRAPRCLFLDELNRATPEVMQAAFQVVLDRELNGWKLHPETRVFAAVNASAAYTVNEMDPALLDRFWVVDLTPTVADWVTWAKDGHVHDMVVDFIAGNEKWLDAPKDSEPGKVTPSRRSWERLSDALTVAGVVEDPKHELFYPMCLGYVGTEATIAFHSFAKTIENQVSGEEVLKDYAKCKKKVTKLGQEKQNVLIEKVSEYVTKNLKTLDENQGKNLAAFMKDLPGELRVSAWSKLTQGAGTENLELAKSVHKYCVETVLEVFGVSADAAVKAISATGGKKAAKK
jgi:Skp family chaperone for outer membrane proteins